MVAPPLRSGRSCARHASTRRLPSLLRMIHAKPDQPPPKEIGGAQWVTTENMEHTAIRREANAPLHVLISSPCGSLSWPTPRPEDQGEPHATHIAWGTCTATRNDGQTRHCHVKD